jgi:LmbE family N-acetylglucosaminyl deacetylase
VEAWLLVTVVFVHAHPDDEAIFTGGTMARLVRAGTPVVLVVATGGELGAVHPSYHGAIDDVGLAEVRRIECEAAAAILGASTVEFLGYHDSGMAGDATNAAPGSFSAAPAGQAAGRLADILTRVAAVAVVGYDEDGIYQHPDHIQVTNVVRAAAERARVPTVYGATVDREYLHFVESHIVAEAGLVDDLGLVRSRIGVATVEVAVAVDVRETLDQKRAAIAAHASQIPESSSVLQLPDHHFAEVYGWEWFVRWGDPGPLEDLT